MTQELVLQNTIDYVKQTLSGEGSGHDWWHVYRVWKMATGIGKEEGADLYIVQEAALLHDISDWKFNDGDDSVGPRIAREWLEKMSVEEKAISHICEIIKDMSFKGANVKTSMPTIEGKIVQDADRLDAIGAIGIARTFAYGGHKGREIYNPEIRPTLHNSFEEYQKNISHTVNHFYEKLLLLKETMNTETAKRLAEERHHFMELYLQHFFEEWEGQK